jgi:hypothetical protein
MEGNTTHWSNEKEQTSIKVVPIIGICGEIDLNSFVLNKHEVSY